jgi:hypothetical protein
MIFPIVAPPDPRGPWFEQTWIYIISEIFYVNMSSWLCGSWEKNFKWPHPFLHFWPGCTKCIRLIEWWMPGGRAGWRASLIGYLLCVINSSHTFRLTFIKPCTIVMDTHTFTLTFLKPCTVAVDTLKMCMWLSGRLQTLFVKFSCSWT